MSVARRPPPVPAEFALLYKFANSLDLRRFAEGGAPHRAGDKQERNARAERGDRLFRAELCGEASGGLRPTRNDALAGLSAVTAEPYDSTRVGSVDRLKMCAAEECKRVFFDRSKRWAPIRKPAGSASMNDFGTGLFEGVGLPWIAVSDIHINHRRVEHPGVLFDRTCPRLRFADK